MVRYEIKIINNQKIEQVTNQGVVLSNGALIKSSMIISTIGQSRTIMQGTEKMERDPGKRIFVNALLQINHHNDIWGAGDSVHVLQAKTQKACPSNALWAIKQGGHAGNNISRAILAQPLHNFTYKGLGQCASLGIGKGIGEIYGVEFTGWTAWIMRWFFFQYFMPLKNIMWREILDWLHLFISRRRIEFTSMNSPVFKFFNREIVTPDNLKQPVYQN